MKNRRIFVDIYFMCIEGQGVTKVWSVNSRTLHIQVDINIAHHQNRLCFLTTIVHELAHILVFVTPSSERFPDQGEQFILKNGKLGEI